MRWEFDARFKHRPIHVIKLDLLEVDFSASCVSCLPDPVAPFQVLFVVTACADGSVIVVRQHGDNLARIARYPLSAL